MKRWLIGIAVVLCVAGAVWFSIRQLQRKAIDSQKETPTATAEVRDIRETIHVVGEVASALSIDIKSEVSGQIKLAFVENGLLVTNRQLLLMLDRSELESQRNELEAEIQSASLRVEKAKSDNDRLRSLFQSGLVTDKDFHDSKIDVALAENELKIQRTRLQTLDQQLAKTSLYAPCDGMVIQCEAKPGQVIVGASSVSQGTVLMKIVQLDRLIVKSNVNEVDALKLAKGMEAGITFDSIPELTVAGIVRSVSPSAQGADGKEAAAKESLRMFPVEIACSVADPRIRLGISANVNVPIAEAKQVVAVSIAAVFADGTNKVAFAQRNGKFEKRAVEAGMSNAQHVEIKNGLQAGDIVALSYPPEFQPKDKKKKEDDDDW